MNKITSISNIRIISTILIFSCHIFQSFDNFLAWWLNIGVQIFFVMAGFLSASSSLKGFTFFRRKILRILVPYLIFLIIVLPLYHGINNLDFKNILIYFTGVQAFNLNSTINGLGHLWFISIILLSYLIASILQTLKFKLSFKSFKKVLILSLICILVSMKVFSEIFYLPWLLLFVIGYSLNANSNLISSYRVKYSAIISTLLFFVLRIFIELDMIRNFNVLGHNLIIWSKVFMSLGLFIILYNFTRKQNLSSIKGFGIIESYSYEIYLTHQIFILGPFSLSRISQNSVLNIIIIILVTYLFSFLLQKLSTYIYKIPFIFNKTNKATC